MVSKVRGRFTRFEGSFVTASDPLDSSASATIDMTSIDTNNPTRDDDLRSKNFFEVDQYPQMTYRSTGLRLDGEQFIFDGELTAHGSPGKFRCESRSTGTVPTHTATSDPDSPRRDRSNAATSA